MEKKKYISEIPHLMKEWDYETNAGLDPTKITAGSNKKVWWVCEKCGGKWQTIIRHRTNGSGCPYCSHTKVLLGVNDLKTTNPRLALEWHPTKNDNLQPTHVVAGSKKRIWWQCPKCKGEWRATIYDRINGSGCPYCSGRKALPGFNDLKTTHPHLASEWHPTKNENLRSTDVTIGSNKKVWWKCPVGHEYQTKVVQRKRTNCPVCALRKQTSFPEQAIFYYVKKLWPNSLNKYKDCFNNGMEFDIYIPENKTAIEYDGSHWHKTDDVYGREVQKYKFCKKHKIYLIRVKESTEHSWNNTSDKIFCLPKVKNRNYHMMELVIRNLLNSIDNIKHQLKIDIEKDENKILSNYLSKIDNSLRDTRPDVAEKWHPTKNGNLTPDMFSYSSNEIVWWKCPACGNEWKTSINGITAQVYACPQCAKFQRGETRRKLSVLQKGSLAQKMPELAREWHPTKNGNLTPHDVTIGSGKKVWWLCLKCGHEWQTAVASRRGCPVCTNKVCIPGKNDFATTHPNLVKEWHPTKNANLKPTNVVAGSEKKVWWLCSICGKSWQSTINTRAYYNHEGCHSCNHTLARLRIKHKQKTT